MAQKKSANGAKGAAARIVLIHKTGSKSGQTSEFPLAKHTQLIFGREAGADVQYDPQGDDLVSRRHAQISIQGNSPDDYAFTLTDLGSSNGTFVNGQRIMGDSRIQIGDSIQFGAGGPMFEFDMQPRPAQAMKATRLAAAAAGPTRESATGFTDGDQAMVPRTVGKATVERMISHVKGESKKTLAGVASAFIVVFAAGSWFFMDAQKESRLELEHSQDQLSQMNSKLDQSSEQLGRMEDQVKKSQAELRRSRQQLQKTRKEMLQANKEPKANQPEGEHKHMTNGKAATNGNGAAPHGSDRMKSPTEIVNEYINSVVFVEMAWNLIWAPTGERIYHQRWPVKVQNTALNPKGDKYQIVAAYYLLADGETLEPVLTTESESEMKGVKYKNVPIGNGGTGTGFVVSNNGFILTNRHVAAGWETSYIWRSYAAPGVLLGLDNKGRYKESSTLITAAQLPQQFVPTKARQIGGKPVKGKVLEGRNAYLDVTFAKTELRVPASLARVSNRHDVAMLKIDLPAAVKKVELFPNDNLQPGTRAIVLGYPGVSPNPAVLTRSEDLFNPSAEVRVVPDITVSGGLVQKIIRGSDAPLERNVYEYFNMGDYIQMSVAGTGSGNSGGPVFDEQGRVIGIYTAGLGVNGVSLVSYAVPIRYGMELMGITRVIR